MRKKIVFLADCLVTQSAGIHFYAKHFIQSCIKQYPNHEYFCVLPSPYGKLELEEIIVPIKKLPFHYRLRSLFGIPKKVNAIKPDLVIEMAHFGPFNTSDRIKTCTIVHDLTPLTNPEWHDQSSHKWHKHFFEKTLKKRDYIITNSNSTKKDLLELLKINENKISVCYPSINAKAQKQETKNVYGNYILSVGTIEPRKNFLALLKAFEIIANSKLDLQLVIAGKSGWKNKEIYSYRENSSFKNRIHFTGYISESQKAKLYSNAKAFVYPTHKEGFGIPLLEAMSYGLPIACSDLDITREVCNNAGLFFDKDQPKDIASSITSIIDSKDIESNLRALSLNRYKDFSSIQFNIDRIINSL